MYLLPLEGVTMAYRYRFLSIVHCLISLFITGMVVVNVARQTREW